MKNITFALWFLSNVYLRSQAFSSVLLSHGLDFLWPFWSDVQCIGQKILYVQSKLDQVQQCFSCASKNTSLFPPEWEEKSRERTSRVSHHSHVRKPLTEGETLHCSVRCVFVCMSMRLQPIFLFTSLQTGVGIGKANIAFLSHRAALFVFSLWGGEVELRLGLYSYKPARSPPSGAPMLGATPTGAGHFI